MASSLSLVARLLVTLIQIYQRFISPLLGSHCRFTLTCSQYGILAVRNFGAIKGFWLILKRILKCHPFSSSSDDPVPPRNYDNREH